MQKITKEYYVGSARVTLTSDKDYADILDTTVDIGAEFVCCIAGVDRDAFIEDFRKLVEKYRI